MEVLLVHVILKDEETVRLEEEGEEVARLQTGIAILSGKRSIMPMPSILFWGWGHLGTRLCGFSPSQL